jgi:hypothetical protein
LYKVRGVKTKRLQKVERKITATCVRTVLSFGRKMKRSLNIGGKRSKRETVPLSPSTAEGHKEWTCPHSDQGTCSCFHIKHLQPVYTMCSGLNFCEPNVYCTEMSRTQVTDTFFRKFQTICTKTKWVFHTVTLQDIF